jgi:hypothetical protein
MNSILPTSGDSDTQAVRKLFEEYAASLAIDLSLHHSGNPPALPGRLPKFDSSGNMSGETMAKAPQHDSRVKQTTCSETWMRLHCRSFHVPVIGLEPRRALDEREPGRSAIWRMCDHRPKGHAALSRSSSDKPPALPEVSDSSCFGYLSGIRACRMGLSGVCSLAGPLGVRREVITA